MREKKFGRQRRIEKDEMSGSTISFVMMALTNNRKR